MIPDSLKVISEKPQVNQVVPYTGPCGLTTKHIYNTCQEKPGWIPKEVSNQQKEKPLKSLLFDQGEKPREAPQGSIKYQSNARASLGTLFHNFLRFFNPNIY